MRKVLLRTLGACLSVLLLIVAFHPAQVAATPPSEGNLNYAAASVGAAASAFTWESGYPPSRAIDEDPTTAWRATANDELEILFDELVDLLEVHVHLADDPLPTVEVYRRDEAGSFALLRAWTENAAPDLVHPIPGGVLATGLRVAFPTPLHHEESYTHEHCEVIYGDLMDCWTETHTHVEDHYARVADVEAWGQEPDVDGDGLPDGLEEGRRHRQTVAAAGLPADLPDNGTDVLVLPLERPPWAGLGTAAFLDLEVDHGAVGQLAVAVGAWNGSAWDDRWAWAPGPFANETVWDAVVIAHTHATTECIVHVHWTPEGEELHCHYEYTEEHVYPGRPVVREAGTALTLATTTTPTNASSTVSGSVHHVTIDLRKATLEAWEADAGFRAPQFSAADLQDRTAWRVLVRDWNPDSTAGGVLSAALVTEERSDPTDPDTDGDGLLDGWDEGPLGTFPVAADTDWDGLSDLMERDPWSLTLTVDGTTSTVQVTTSPTAWDSDGDGLSDGEEAELGFDGAVTNPTVPDTDGDGLEDGEEALTHFTNASRTDTDGDGLSDVDELFTWGTLPYLADSDDDGLSDYEEVQTLRSFTFSFPVATVTQCGISDCYLEGPHRQGWLVDSGTYALPPTWHPEGEYFNTNLIGYHWAFRGASGLRYLLSPPLSLASTLSPTLRFTYSLEGTGTAEVAIVNPSGYASAAALAGTGGLWGTYELDLGPWQESLRQVGFAASSTDSNFAFLVDGVSIRGKTDPWVADTDGDGLEDGAEVEVWGSHPLTNDTDWDGIEDRYDPRLDGDDFPPYAEEIHSDDYRTGLSIALAETSGVLHWQGIIQHHNGMMYCTESSLCGNWEPFLQVEERTRNFYVLSFDLASLSMDPGEVSNVQIRAYDASGLELEILYFLEVDSSGASTNWWQDLSLFLVAGATGNAFGSGTAYLSETGTVAASSVTTAAAVGLAVFIFALFCCTLDQSGSPSGSQPEWVWMSSDAVPLQTYATALGTVALFDGFNASAGGLQRGLGWDYITALHPEATYALLADILAFGTYATEGAWTTVTWVTTVGGVETLYRLLLKDLVVISLGVFEVVNDIEGNQIAFDEGKVKWIYENKHPELQELYATFEGFVDEVKENLKKPNEFWKDVNGDRKFRWMYIRWIDGESWRTAEHGLIVITEGGGGIVTAYVARKPYIIGEARTLGPFEWCVYPEPPPR